MVEVAEAEGMVGAGLVLVQACHGEEGGAWLWMEKCTIC